MCYSHFFSTFVLINTLIYMFNSYRSFIPKISTLFVLTLLFWGGWILAFILLIILGLIFPLFPTYQSAELVICMIFSFGLPMFYAYRKAQKQLKDPECVQVIVDEPDYGKYGAPVWWIGSITVGSMLILLALWITSFIPANNTMGSYSILMDNLQLSTFDIIVSELLVSPLFTVWLICAVCVRGLAQNGISFPLSLAAAVIAIFLMNLDYMMMVASVAEVACIGIIYKNTHSMKLAYVTMMVMCGIECLNLINHFIY